MRTTLVLFALLALASAGSDFYLCEVVVPNFCSVSSSVERSCSAEPSLTMEGTAYSLTDNYNLIALGDFVGDGSDIEARIAVKGSGSVQSGYSIGDLVNTKGPGAIDSRVPYSAIFGQDFSWPTGRLYPDGLDQDKAAYNEDMYVGGVFTTTESDLNGRVTQDTRTPGAFDAEFESARAFYTDVQNALAAVTDNINIVVQYGTATVTCDASSTSYSGSIGTNDLGSVTAWVFSGCAIEIQMVINVLDDGVNQINFHYGSFNEQQRKIERTVFNVLGSGRVLDFVATGWESIILAPNNNYQQNGGYTQGIIIVNNVVTSHQINRVRCVRPTPPATPSPCVSFESTCAGTLFSTPDSTMTADSRQYNVISFGNFVADTGDVEGRVMCRDNFVVGNGYSVGYEVSTANNVPDQQQDFSLIAGRACTWGSGALYPSGTGSPHAGAQEDAFCGDSFTAPTDLTARQGGSCNGQSGCLDAIFDGVKACYDSYASNLAATVDNTQHTVNESAMIITCNDATATSYAVTFSDVDMQSFTYYVTVGCNFQAYWTINIVGSGPVTFSGDSFPAPAGAVVYNIQGCRTINVHDTAVNGHMLSTCSTLNQTAGVIYGKVVVGDVIMSLQVNKENTCQTPSNVTVTIVISDQTPPTGYDFCAINAYLAQVGDQLIVPDSDASLEITAVEDDCITINNNVPSLAGVIDVTAGKIAGKVIKSSDDGTGARTNQPNKSSASMVSVSVAIIALVALLI